MGKRIVAFCLVISVLLGFAAIGGCGEKESVPSPTGNEGTENGEVLRGQWITMLAQIFGMDQYLSSDPYYSDVGENSDIFPYVQATHEWGVLSIYGDDKLEPDKSLTLEEMASTAAIAAGFEPDNAQFDENGKFLGEMSVEFARSHGIIDAGADMSKIATLAECESALEAARETYMDPDAEEEREIVEYTEKVKDISAISEVVQIDENRISVPITLDNSVRSDSEGGQVATIDTGNGMSEIRVGDVLMTAGTAEHPAGVAYKVSAITEVDGQIVFDTVEPELEDAFSDVDIHKTVTADASDIIWDPGVTVTEITGEPQASVPQPYIDYLTYDENGAHAAPMEFSLSKSYSASFHMGGGCEKKWENRNSSAIGSGAGAHKLEDSNFVYDKQPSIEDFGGSTDSWESELMTENKFTGGYSIDGLISIDAITVTVDYDHEWKFIVPVINRVSLSVDSQITASLDFKGNIGNRLHVAKVPLPIVPGISVVVDLYLNFNASGELYLQASFENSAKIEYREGCALKRTSQSDASFEARIAIDIYTDAELAATLELLGFIDAMDARIKAGADLTASAYVGGSCEVSTDGDNTTTKYQQAMKLKADLYVPIITVYVEAFGKSKEWNIVDRNNAKRIGLVNEEWIFWEETVITDKNGTEIDRVIQEGLDIDITPESEKIIAIVLDKYAVNVGTEPVQLSVIESELAADAYTWESSNSLIVSVNETGVLTPFSAGFALVTVALKDDPTIYTTCTVCVMESGDNGWEFLPPDIDENWT